MPKHDRELFAWPTGGSWLSAKDPVERSLSILQNDRARSTAYASRTRVFREKRGLTLVSLGDSDNATSKAEPELSPKKRAALRKSWARLIKRVYQVDPLKCDCGVNATRVGFITEHKVIRKILDHLDKRNGDSRAPPKH